MNQDISSDVNKKQQNEELKQNQEKSVDSKLSKPKSKEPKIKRKQNLVKVQNLDPKSSQKVSGLPKKKVGQKVNGDVSKIVKNLNSNINSTNKSPRKFIKQGTLKLNNQTTQKLEKQSSKIINNQDSQSNIQSKQTLASQNLQSQKTLDNEENKEQHNQQNKKETEIIPKPPEQQNNTEEKVKQRRKKRNENSDLGSILNSISVQANGKPMNELQVVNQMKKQEELNRILKEKEQKELQEKKLKEEKMNQNEQSMLYNINDVSIMNQQSGDFSAGYEFKNKKSPSIIQQERKQSILNFSQLKYTKKSNFKEKEIKQMKQLAEQIGINYELEGKTKYAQMLFEMIITDLPDGWVKELDPNKEVIFFNELQNKAQKLHPLIGRFRSYFYELLDKENELEIEKIELENQEVEVQKKEKEPLTKKQLKQQKLDNQNADNNTTTININNNNNEKNNNNLMNQSNTQKEQDSQKDSNKKNMDKSYIKKNFATKNNNFHQKLTSVNTSVQQGGDDQNDSYQTQTTQNNNINNQNNNNNNNINNNNNNNNYNSYKQQIQELNKKKKIIACQSLQSIVPEDQNQKSRKHFDKTLSTLGQIHKQRQIYDKEKKQNFDGNIRNQEIIDEVMEINKKYYINIYTDDPLTVQKQANTIKDYKRADPQEILNYIKFFKLDKDSKQLYWLAQLYFTIPLPENWEYSYDSDKQNTNYTCTIVNGEYLYSDLHPSYLYIQHMIQIFKQIIISKQSKQEFEKKEKKACFITIEDVLFRQYTVNIQKMIDNTEIDIEVVKKSSKQRQQKIAQELAILQAKQAKKIQEEQKENDNENEIDDDLENYDNQEQHINEENNTYQQMVIANTLLNQKQDQALVNIQEEYELQQEQERIESNNENKILNERVKQFDQYYEQKLEQDGQFQDQLLDLQYKEHRLYKQMLIEKQLISTLTNNLNTNKSKQNCFPKVMTNLIPINLKDDHILAIANQLMVKLPEEAHLLNIIAEYVIWKQEGVYNEWIFRNNKDGDFYWIRGNKSKTSVEYPYIDELSKILSLTQKVIEKESKSGKFQFKKRYLKSMTKLLNIQKNSDKEKALISLKKEAKLFVLNFLETNNREYIIHQFIDYNKQKLVQMKKTQRQNERKSTQFANNEVSSQTSDEDSNPNSPLQKQKISDQISQYENKDGIVNLQLQIQQMQSQQNQVFGSSQIPNFNKQDQLNNSQQQKQISNNLLKVQESSNQYLMGKQNSHINLDETNINKSYQNQVNNRSFALEYSEPYTLSHILKYLRNDYNYNNNTIKENLLFNYPWSLKTIKNKKKLDIIRQQYNKNQEIESELLKQGENQGKRGSDFNSTKSQSFMKQIITSQFGDQIQFLKPEKESLRPLSTDIFTDTNKFFKCNFDEDEFDFATSEYETDDDTNQDKISLGFVSDQDFLSQNEENSKEKDIEDIKSALMISSSSSQQSSQQRDEDSFQFSNQSINEDNMISKESDTESNSNSNSISVSDVNVSSVSITNSNISGERQELDELEVEDQDQQEEQDIESSEDSSVSEDQQQEKGKELNLDSQNQEQANNTLQLPSLKKKNKVRQNSKIKRTPKKSISKSISIGKSKKKQSSNISTPKNNENIHIISGFGELQNKLNNQEYEKQQQQDVNIQINILPGEENQKQEQQQQNLDNQNNFKIVINTPSPTSSNKNSITSTKSLTKHKKSVSNINGKSKSPKSKTKKIKKSKAFSKKSISQIEELQIQPQDQVQVKYPNLLTFDNNNNENQLQIKEQNTQNQNLKVENQKNDTNQEKQKQKEEKIQKKRELKKAQKLAEKKEKKKQEKKIVKKVEKTSRNAVQQRKLNQIKTEDVENIDKNLIESTVNDIQYKRELSKAATKLKEQQILNQYFVNQNQKVIQEEKKQKKDNNNKQRAQDPIVNKKKSKMKRSLKKKQQVLDSLHLKEKELEKLIKIQDDDLVKRSIYLDKLKAIQIDQGSSSNNINTLQSLAKSLNIQTSLLSGNQQDLKNEALNMENDKEFQEKQNQIQLEEKNRQKLIEEKKLKEQRVEQKKKEAELIHQQLLEELSEIRNSIQQIKQESNSNSTNTNNIQMELAEVSEEDEDNINSNRIIELNEDTDEQINNESQIIQQQKNSIKNINNSNTNNIKSFDINQKQKIKYNTEKSQSTTYDYQKQQQKLNVENKQNNYNKSLDVNINKKQINIQNQKQPLVSQKRNLSNKQESNQEYNYNYDSNQNTIQKNQNYNNINKVTKNNDNQLLNNKNNINSNSINSSSNNNYNIKDYQNENKKSIKEVKFFKKSTSESNQNQKDLFYTKKRQFHTQKQQNQSNNFKNTAQQKNLLKLQKKYGVPAIFEVSSSLEGKLVYSKNNLQYEYDNLDEDEDDEDEEEEYNDHNDYEQQNQGQQNSNSQGQHINKKSIQQNQGQVQTQEQLKENLKNFIIQNQQQSDKEFQQKGEKLQKKFDKENKIQTNTSQIKQQIKESQQKLLTEAFSKVTPLVQQLLQEQSSQIRVIKSAQSFQNNNRKIFKSLSPYKKENQSLKIADIQAQQDENPLSPLKNQNKTNQDLYPKLRSKTQNQLNSPLGSRKNLSQRPQSPQEKFKLGQQINSVVRSNIQNDRYDQFQRKNNLSKTLPSLQYNFKSQKTLDQEIVIRNQNQSPKTQIQINTLLPQEQINILQKKQRLDNLSKPKSANIIKLDPINQEIRKAGQVRAIPVSAQELQSTKMKSNQNLSYSRSLENSQDNFTHYRLQTVLANIAKNLHFTRLDIRNNKNQSEKVLDSVKYFEEQAAQELENLRKKAILRKINQLSFNFLLEKIPNFNESDKSLIQQSQELHQRFYKQIKFLVDKIRNFLVKIYIQAQDQEFQNYKENNNQMLNINCIQKVIQISLKEEDLQEEDIQKFNNILQDQFIEELELINIQEIIPILLKNQQIQNNKKKSVTELEYMFQQGIQQQLKQNIQQRKQAEEDASAEEKKRISIIKKRKSFIPRQSQHSLLDKRHSSTFLDQDQKNYDYQNQNYDELNDSLQQLSHQEKQDFFLLTQPIFLNSIYDSNMLKINNLNEKYDLDIQQKKIKQIQYKRLGDVKKDREIQKQIDFIDQQKKMIELQKQFEIEHGTDEQLPLKQFDINQELENLQLEDLTKEEYLLKHKNLYKFNLREKLSHFSNAENTEIMKYKKIQNALKPDVLYSNNKKEINQVKQQQKVLKDIFQYQKLIETIEIWYEMKAQNKIFRALKKEIKDIHQIYRNVIARFEINLDYGLNIQHVQNMIKFLKIDLSAEGDLVWIAYLFCVFLIKYSPAQNIEFLEIAINTFQDQEVEEENYEIMLRYFQFFKILLQFQRIKRYFILDILNSKNKREYLTETAWMKFYDLKNQKFYFQNFVTNQRQDDILTQKTIYIQEKFYIMEKISFIEIMDGLAAIIQNENQINQNNNNQNKNQKQELENLKNFVQQNSSEELNSADEYKQVIQNKYNNIQYKEEEFQLE